MGLKICFVSLLFFALLGIATPSFLDYDRLETGGEEGRSLLYRRSSKCPFDVARMNYTIVTSKCKRQPGSNSYNSAICCKSLKKLACKHRDDLSGANECATQMFAYLRHHGKYHAGVFMYACKQFEGGRKPGIDCTGY